MNFILSTRIHLKSTKGFLKLIRRLFGVTYDELKEEDDDDDDRGRTLIKPLTYFVY